ncbi:diphthine methyltransferase [Anabrus simplex]|uniref:diphthine methyltransferase n=1 Tax=Anabrus simplex TaxID=316456 RepID=UPI0035A3378C
METLHTWDTEYSADSVEWCPVQPYHHIFVCGTYQLSQESELQENSSSSDVRTGEETVSRKIQKFGRLYLFCIDSSANLVHLQTLETPAILDTKWCHRKINDRVLLGVANAKGDLAVYELSEKHPENGDNAVECHNYKLLLVNKINISDEDDSGVLALSLDWSTGKFDESEPSIIVSDSRGVISLLSLRHSSIQQFRSWKAHSYEAWITAFNYWNTSVIYSGGDDCKLHAFDLRYDSDSPVMTSKAHEMGVTSIHCNVVHENIMISGSYDEKLRVWDTRSMKQPLSVRSLTGGIWRLKWDPHHWQHVLAACMHGGFCVINCPSNSDCPNIVTEYKEHSSLAYGSDWCHMEGTQVRAILGNKVKHKSASNDTYVIATCSFYDHKLCVSILNT